MMKFAFPSIMAVILLILASSKSMADDYIYKLTGGINYWATADVYGSLGEYRLADGEHGVNYYYSGTRYGFWVDAKSGFILLPNLKFRYQDIRYSGTGNIEETINIEIANIDLSSLLGDVESDISFTYIEAITSMNMPIEAFDLEAGLKLRLHAVNYGIGLVGEEKQSNGFYAPIPFIYLGASKSFLDDNLSIHGEYGYLGFSGTRFETIDAFLRYQVPLENVFPLDIKVQAGFQSFAFNIDADSPFNFLTNDDGYFGFDSFVASAILSF